jgi:DNA-binding CsgD family transcriptional regulator
MRRAGAGPAGPGPAPALVLGSLPVGRVVACAPAAGPARRRVADVDGRRDRRSPGGAGLAGLSETTARDAARRRAVDLLKLTASVAAYAAERVGNGLSPEQARAAVAESAAELDAAAAALRRLVRPMRLSPAARRELAVRLAASGRTRREIAGQLGVAPSTVGDYLTGRRAAAGRDRFPGPPATAGEPVPAPEHAGGSALVNSRTATGTLM